MALGVRFAAYLVVDGEFATAPFLHAAGKLGLPVVARLKANLPELLAAAQKRFRSQPPKLTLRYGSDRVEFWDAEDFDPWEPLRWATVRVVFYRQQKSALQETRRCKPFSPTAKKNCEETDRVLGCERARRLVCSRSRESSRSVPSAEIRSCSLVGKLGRSSQCYLPPPSR